MAITKMMQYKVKIVMSMVCMGCIYSVLAQDTTKRKSIDITSTFKPVLKESAKINFNASPPSTDTTRPRLNYNIPVQNLLFTYQPAELRPVPLSLDSIVAWQSSNYIKAGIGNVHQPYIEAGFSFGNSKNTFFNLFARHYNSKGKLDYQKNSLTSVTAAATYLTSKNIEWNAALGFRSNDYYLYGYKPDTLVFSKDQLKQRFQTIEGKVHFRNTVPTEFGLSWNPSIRISSFSDNKGLKATESNSVLQLPLEKTFGRAFGARVGFTADLTKYNRKGNPVIISDQNNLFMVPVAVEFKTPNVYIHGGLIPSWDNKAFHMLPNIMADLITNNQRLTFQFGWTGYYDKGSYKRFASINPWLAQPDSLVNTRVRDLYGGFRGSAGNHFTFSTKIGYVKSYNMPLFVNDEVDGKTFLIRYEPLMETLLFHGELQYFRGEEFSATAAFNLNTYKTVQEKKAWGMIPAEITTTLRWQLMKDLWLRGDIWIWDGPQYEGTNGEAYKGETGFDVNAGAEFRITRNFNAWLQLNNIFNNKYERWHNYESFGFNILGGVTYSFNQK